MNGKQLFTTFNKMNVEYWVKGPKIRSIFLKDDGIACLDQDFSEHLDKEHFWKYAYSCGYGHDLLRYLQEHDFIHHWLADKLNSQISPALLYAAEHFYKNGENFDDVPDHIKKEEDLVHVVQQHIRLGFTEMLMNQEKGAEAHAIIDSLKRDLTIFFDGQWDLYPGSAPVSCYLVWAKETHGQETHDSEKAYFVRKGMIDAD